MTRRRGLRDLSASVFAPMSRTARRAEAVVDVNRATVLQIARDALVNIFLPFWRARVPLRGYERPDGECIRRFGVGGAPSFGPVEVTDSELERSGNEGSGFVDGDVDAAMFGRFVRSCRRQYGA